MEDHVREFTQQREKFLAILVNRVECKQNENAGHNKKCLEDNKLKRDQQSVISQRS